jgi:hypothetical protein
LKYRDFDQLLLRHSSKAEALAQRARWRDHVETCDRKQARVARRTKAVPAADGMDHSGDALDYVTPTYTVTEECKWTFSNLGGDALYPMARGGVLGPLTPPAP